MSKTGKLFSRFKWDRIMTALLAAAIGVLFIAMPETSADMLCTISGALLVAAGAVSLLIYAIYRTPGGLSLIAAIVLLTAGIFCLTNVAVVQGMLTVIFGMLIIVDAARSLRDSIECARTGAGAWLFMLVISLLTLVLGCIVLFVKFDAVMIFAGVSLIVDAVCDLIMTFIFSRRIREAKKFLMDQKREEIEKKKEQADKKENED